MSYQLKRENLYSCLFLILLLILYLISFFEWQHRQTDPFESNKTKEKTQSDKKPTNHTLPRQQQHRNKHNLTVKNIHPIHYSQWALSKEALVLPSHSVMLWWWLRCQRRMRSHRSNRLSNRTLLIIPRPESLVGKLPLIFSLDSLTIPKRN